MFGLPPGLKGIAQEKANAILKPFEIPHAEDGESVTYGEEDAANDMGASSSNFNKAEQHLHGSNDPYEAVDDDLKDDDEHHDKAEADKQQSSQSKETKQHPHGFKDPFQDVDDVSKDGDEHNDKAKADEQRSSQSKETKQHPHGFKDPFQDVDDGSKDGDEHNNPAKTNASGSREKQEDRMYNGKYYGGQHKYEMERAKYGQDISTNVEGKDVDVKPSEDAVLKATAERYSEMVKARRIKGVPEVLKSFYVKKSIDDDAFDVNPEVSAACKLIGIQNLFPIQEELLTTLGGNIKCDLYLESRGASGKTMGMIIAIVSYFKRHETFKKRTSMYKGHGIAQPLVLFIVPTRELANEVHGNFIEVARYSYLRVCGLIGEMDIQKQLQDLRRGCDILVVTPGRANHIFQRYRRVITGDHLRLVVMDEVDAMLRQTFVQQFKEKKSKNLSFKESRNEQKSFYEQLKETQSFFVDDSYFDPNFWFAAANFPDDCLDLVGNMSDGLMRSVTADENAAGESVRFTRVTLKFAHTKFGEARTSDIANYVQQLPSHFRVLILTVTKRSSQHIEAALTDLNISCIEVNSNYHQSLREVNLRKYIDDKARVLLSPSGLLGRGVNLKETNHLVIEALPRDEDEMVLFFAGLARVGRVGETGEALIFYDLEKDCILAPYLIEYLEKNGQAVPEFLRESPFKDKTSFRQFGTGMASGWS